MNNVKAGQIWQDWDIRSRVGRWQRFIRVIIIDDMNALCENIQTHRITKIRLNRFKPNSTGYKLWKDI